MRHSCGLSCTRQTKPTPVVVERSRLPVHPIGEAHPSLLDLISLGAMIQCNVGASCSCLGRLSQCVINYLCETPRGHVLLERSEEAWLPSMELRHALRFATDQVFKPGLTANQGWEAFNSSVDLLVLRLIMHVIEHNAPELRLVPPLPVSGTCPAM